MASNMSDDAYSHGNGEEGQTSTSAPSQSIRKGRGPSKGKKSAQDGKKICISTNECGQPNEDDQDTRDLSTSIGTETRELLPITYRSFHEIPNEYRQKVVDALEEVYDLTYVSPIYIRDKMSAAFRLNKCALKETYIGKLDKATVKASEAPPFVPREDWLKFVDWCFSDQFLALSERNKANRSKLLAPNTLGRKSMAVVRHKIAKERNLRLDAEVGRSEIYIRAQTKKDKTIQCPRNIAKIEKILQENPDARETSCDDALSQVLGKDSRGRMRGMGAGVSRTLLRMSTHMVKKNNDLQTKNATTLAIVENLQKDMEEVKDFVKNFKSNLQSGSDNSSRTACTLTKSHMPKSLDACNIGKICKIYSWPHVQVAEGEVVEVDPEVAVHHIPMGEGNYKICLTRILDGNALLFKGNSNVRILDDVGFGGFVVWPKNFLEFEI